jgi:hypothetical protein
MTAVARTNARPILTRTEIAGHQSGVPDGDPAT